MKTNDEIRSACEAFLETWDRREWMAEHGSWASESDDSISSESDYIEEGMLDPDEVEADAERLDVHSRVVSGWDCREGWRAMRSGDALVLNWWRNPTTDLRHKRDLYVVIDREFFGEEDDDPDSPTYFAHFSP